MSIRIIASTAIQRQDFIGTAGIAENAYTYMVLAGFPCYGYKDFDVKVVIRYSAYCPQSYINGSVQTGKYSVISFWGSILIPIFWKRLAFVPFSDGKRNGMNGHNALYSRS